MADPAIALQHLRLDAPRMREAIEKRAAGILTYGITPPKRTFPPQKRQEVGRVQAERIGMLPIDGLVIYDVQDEADRTSEERPFPFVESIDPVEYAYHDLRGVAVPKVVYQCVSPRTPGQLLAAWEQVIAHHDHCVLVGSASHLQKVSMRLSEAYAWRSARCPGLSLGGVLIPERHQGSRGEDERVIRKLDAGCSFFISQAVYAVEASKNVLSDLHYRCASEGRPVPPVLVTLSPCGSQKTLEFMRWLGIAIPRWLENELSHAHDILETSLDVCTSILRDLVHFAASKGIPLGCNVESVSVRKVEIEASVELVHRARSILDEARHR